MFWGLGPCFAERLTFWRDCSGLPSRIALVILLFCKNHVAAENLYAYQIHRAALNFCKIEIEIFTRLQVIFVCMIKMDDFPVFPDFRCCQRAWPPSRAAASGRSLMMRFWLPHTQVGQKKCWLHKSQQLERFDDIIYSALLSLPLSGWVTGLTTEPQKAEAGPGDEVRMSKETQSKVEALRCELDVPVSLCNGWSLMSKWSAVRHTVGFPGQSWSSCSSKSCRAGSSTSRRRSPAQLSLPCPSLASMTSSLSARTTPATASLSRCRLRLTICCSRSAY